jgi:hypothetical protein
MERLVQAVAGGIVFGIVGFVLLVWAPEVQQFAIKRQTHGWSTKINPFAGFVQTWGFRFWLYLLGGLSSLAALILFAVAYQNAR